jgi:hypothetical protein
LINTVYQNTSGQPMLVIGYATVSTPFTAQVSALCDSSATPSTVVMEWTPGGSATFDLTPFAFMVPNNDYYEISCSGTAVLTSCTEWVINSGSVAFSGELSGSRALSTVYQNTSGNAMLVVVDVSGIGGTSTTITGFSDSSATPSSVVWLTNGFAASTKQTVVMLVPNNHYYEIVCSGGAVAHWNEYSLPFPATKSSDFAVGQANTKLRISGGQYTNFGKDRWIVTSAIAAGGVFCETGPAGSGNPEIWAASITASVSGVALGVCIPLETFEMSAPSYTHWWEYNLG